jgi:hypothetical protein
MVGTVHAKNSCSRIFDDDLIDQLNQKKPLEFELVRKSIWTLSEETVDLIEIYKVGDVFATGRVIFLRDFNGNIKSTHIVKMTGANLNFDRFRSSSGQTEFVLQMYFPKAKYQIVLSRKDRSGNYVSFRSEDL